MCEVSLAVESLYYTYQYALAVGAAAEKCHNLLDVQPWHQRIGHVFEQGVEPTQHYLTGGLSPCEDETNISLPNRGSLRLNGGAV